MGFEEKPKNFSVSGGKEDQGSALRCKRLRGTTKMGPGPKDGQT